MSETVVLKKYANRRIYDTDKSEYVTLKDVSGMIRNGAKVQVVDAKTAEDVTAFILTQIILEEAKQKNSLLPIPILHLIIQYGDNILGEFFNKYMQKSIQHYINYKTTVEAQYDKWMDLGKDASEMAEKAVKNMQPFKSIFDNYFKSDKNSK